MEIRAFDNDITLHCAQRAYLIAFAVPETPITNQELAVCRRFIHTKSKQRLYGGKKAGIPIFCTSCCSI